MGIVDAQQGAGRGEAAAACHDQGIVFGDVGYVGDRVVEYIQMRSAKMHHGVLLDAVDLPLLIKIGIPLGGFGVIAINQVTRDDGETARMSFPKFAVEVFEKVAFVESLLRSWVALEGVDHHVLVAFFGDGLEGTTRRDEVRAQTNHPLDVTLVEFCFELHGIWKLLSPFTKAGGGATVLPEAGTTNRPTDWKTVFLKAGDGLQHGLGIRLPAEGRPRFPAEFKKAELGFDDGVAFCT